MTWRGLSTDVDITGRTPRSSSAYGVRGSRPTRGVALISRPGFPFKITSVQSTSRFLRAHVEPRPGGWEYKLVVEYLGTAPTGDLAATVKLTTDDPARRTLELPVSAVVR